MIIKTPDEFGAQIRARRKARGWTQEQLAARCGVGIRFIVDLEAGKPTCQLGKSLTAAVELGLLLQPAEADVHGGPEPIDPDDPLSHLPRF